jgi:hypothetical protein
MAEMNDRDLQAFKYFMSMWKQQWDLNQYYRGWYDEDLEFYRGYRDPTKQPLLYNLSFNKLLPRVFTVLSRFMSQLYQSSDFVSVKPRKRQDVERADRVRGLLDYQLETLNDCDSHGGSWYFNFKWMFNAIVFGKGICKMYWRKEEQIGPVRMAGPVPQYDQYGRAVGMRMQDLIIEAPQVTDDKEEQAKSPSEERKEIILDTLRRLPNVPLKRIAYDLEVNNGIQVSEATLRAYRKKGEVTEV